MNYNEYVDIQTLKQIKNQFLSDLHKATLGQQTSLPFIRHNLAKTAVIKSGEIFQTLVIGGSICQKATMKKNGNKVDILDQAQVPQPPFLTKNDFMTFLGTHIHPDVEVVALNFAYPLIPIIRNGMLDGILQSGSKENTFSGLVGDKVGAEIETYFQKTFGRTIRVAIANDVICLLLSGLNYHNWDTIAAGIVGTGLNFSLFLDKQTIVNLESGNFNTFPQSESGQEIDRLSASPGSAIFEKEVSGAYLYQHLNILAKKRGIPFPLINSSQELNQLIHHDNTKVAKLAQEILDHSASLVAVEIAGIVNFVKHDLIFIMQGSLYWKGDGYKKHIDDLVRELVPDYHVSYKQIVNSDILGASKLVS